MENASLMGITEQIDNPKDDIEKNKALLIGGHYLKSGKNLVLIIRKWESGSIFTIDDESYEYFTLELSEFTIGKPISLNSNSVKLYYSTGGSAWVYKGIGSYCSKGKGNIKIISYDNDIIEAEIDAVLMPKSAWSLQQRQNKRVKINGDYIFSKFVINRSTLWSEHPDPYLNNGGIPQ